MKKQILTTMAMMLVLSLSPAASAATPEENRGVIGGALIGAAAGGPVGLIAGAALGGHYAHKSSRARRGEEQVAQLKDELASQSQRLAASSADVQRLTVSLEAREATLKLQRERIDALLEDQALLTALGLDVRFATDDAQLSDADQDTLETLAQYLARHPERRVRLHGHADSRGAMPHNDKLSLERSHAVAEALRAAKVDASQIDVLAYGERQATAPQSDADGLAAERRVEVELVPGEGEARSAASQER